jgi:hypothetical protein
MVFISPKSVLVEFLRRRLVDPRSRAEDTNTETFDGGSTSFSLTPTSGTMSCITSVKVDDVEQTKWKNYYIDFQNQKVIFYSDTNSGTDNVSITYKQGSTNWIYPDKAKNTLSKTAFPRINILTFAGTGERVGQYNSDVQSQVSFQIDVWTKENQVFTIDSVKYEGDKLAEYLAYEISKYFRSNEDDLHPALYNYTLLGTPRDMGFDKEIECFHKIVEVEMRGLNIGETYQ